MSKIMPKVFLWMFIGLMITFLTGYYITTNENMMNTIYTNSYYIMFAIIELILVIVFSVRIRKMSPSGCRVMFILYSFISGITFSSIFVAYKLSSIMFYFLIAAIVFLLFAILGYVTKIDLTKLGSYLLMTLLGIIIASIINAFVGNANLDIILSSLILLIFMGITAFDVQKIKRLEKLNAIPEENLAIYGAFELYLDYINIFIELLRLFGDNR